MAKIYTRSGDAGDTALYGGGRVRKDHLRIEVIGDVDELNAAIGAVRAVLARGDSPDADALLGRLQNQLFDLGAELSTPEPQARGTDLVGDDQVAALEAAIDRFDAPLAPLQTFILPGGSPAAAGLHLARCVCRRAERRLVALAAEETVRDEARHYLNRLSDLLFVLARWVNRAEEVADVTWEQGGR